MATEERATRRLTVDFAADDFAEVKRRAREERIPMTNYLRRLVAADADQHPAKP